MEISLMGMEWQGDVIHIQWDVYKVSQNSFLAEGTSMVLVSLGYLWNVARFCSGVAVDFREADTSIWLTGAAHLT